MARRKEETTMQRLAFEGEMTIYHAAEQKARLLAFLDSGDELEIDLAAVDEIDTTGLQLLIMAKQQARRGGKRLGFVLHSPAVIELFELANLVNFFDDPLVLSHRPDRA
jgi:anti-sigma B factor antagonist